MTVAKKKPGRPAGKKPGRPPVTKSVTKPVTKSKADQEYEVKQSKALEHAKDAADAVMELPPNERLPFLAELKKDEPIIHALIREELRERATAARNQAAAGELRAIMESAQQVFNQRNAEAQAQPATPTAPPQVVDPASVRAFAAIKPGTVLRSGVPATAQTTEFDKLVDRVVTLARRLEYRVDGLREKLAPIIMLTPASACSAPPSVQEAAPPLFAEVHKVLDLLNDQINRVANITEDVRL